MSMTPELVELAFRAMMAPRFEQTAEMRFVSTEEIPYPIRSVGIGVDGQAGALLMEAGSEVLLVLDLSDEATLEALYRLDEQLWSRFGAVSLVAPKPRTKNPIWSFRSTRVEKQLLIMMNARSRAEALVIALEHAK